MSNPAAFLQKLVKQAVAGGYAHHAGNPPDQGTVQPVGALEEPAAFPEQVDSANRAVGKAKNMEEGRGALKRSGPIPGGTSDEKAIQQGVAMASVPRVAVPERFQAAAASGKPKPDPTDKGVGQASQLYASTNYFMDTRPDVVRETERRYLSAMAKWLRRNGLLSPTGMALTEGGIGTNVTLTDEMLTPAAKVIMKKHYPAWVKEGRTGKVPSMMKFDKLLPKIREAVMARGTK
jgi:hypothetical protein